MPRINLLPVKAARRVGNARNELITFAAIIGGVLFMLYSWFIALGSEIDDLGERILAIKNDIKQIEKTVTRVEDFKKKTAILEQKLAVIDNLKRQKVGPAKMLDDLATILTKQRKVWLTAITEKEGKITLEGGAMDHENISEFQLALEQQSKFFKAITLTLVKTSNDKDLRYLQWVVTCTTNYAAG